MNGLLGLLQDKNMVWSPPRDGKNIGHNAGAGFQRVQQKRLHPLVATAVWKGSNSGTSAIRKYATIKRK
jgi:hypothetical protein